MAESVSSSAYPPNETLYIQNLNENVRLPGMLCYDLP